MCKGQCQRKCSVPCEREKRPQPVPSQDKNKTINVNVLTTEDLSDRVKVLEQQVEELEKKYKPVAYRTKNRTTGFYTYHVNEPSGLVYETLYVKEGV